MNDIEERDYKPIASSAAIKEFIDSLIHKDFVGEVKLRIEATRDLLEQPETLLKESSYITHDMIVGKIACLREILGIFEQLLDNKIDDEERDHDS